MARGMRRESVLAVQPLLQAPGALSEDGQGPIPADPVAAVTTLLAIEGGVAARYLGRRQDGVWETDAALAVDGVAAFDRGHYDQIFPVVWPVEYLREMMDLGRVFIGIDYLPD